MDFHQLMVPPLSYLSQVLDDLVTYLYAFYDSMKIDMSLQFDFVPINVRKSNKEQSSKLSWNVWTLISKIRNYGRLGKLKVRWVA